MAGSQAEGGGGSVIGNLLDDLGKTAVVWIAVVVGLLGTVGGIAATAFLLDSAKASAEAKLSRHQPYRLQLMVRLFCSLYLFAARDPNLPHVYYEMLRWAVFAICAGSLWVEWKTPSVPWAIILAAVALLFNPVFPMHLSPELWTTIDTVAGTIMFLSILAVLPPSVRWADPLFYSGLSLFFAGLSVSSFGSALGGYAPWSGVLMILLGWPHTDTDTFRL